MANEGSTKPTYSELERQTIKTAALELGVDELFKRWKAAEAENLRVRGLLQRQWISVEERLPESEGFYLVANGDDATSVHSEHFGLYAGFTKWEVGDRKPRSEFGLGASMSWDRVKIPVTHWMPLPVPPNFLQSSNLVSQGAESADIGKLDTVDKSVGATASLTCADCGHSENCMCYSMKICMCKSGGSMDNVATKLELCCNCGSEVIRTAPDGKYAHRSTIDGQSCSRAVPCRRDTCDRGCKAHGTAHPTWMQFVQGKTVESAIEQGDWHIIQFSDGTTFQFTSTDKFVMVEASPQ